MGFFNAERFASRLRIVRRTSIQMFQVEVEHGCEALGIKLHSNLLRSVTTLKVN
jgi:hypothetical protein